ncbi:DUF2141 domain-containing protein [Fibrella forsythiae]|uniref:DUF2141 domain-containing protein n=1 Tax=Fibrella forsythiae TaxID=2817061 RepID=A0ABS3JF78_9BACT|nr:DUF2141 domain-containing protein [Fibrella forsythiae]MBO0948637.1 DUF2141 domain-containing protein [Fibrella forsythiae]
MKTLVLTLSLAALLGSNVAAQAQAKTYTLTINVGNLLERKGTIRVGLMTKAENFMGKADIDTAMTVPTEGPIVITFTNLPAGTYAARLYQDLNNNKQMDMLGGRPEEPFGFSKITMLMGPPTFEDASFNLEKDTEMKIGLISL